jgi:predicted RNA-binding Zn ribbon-like protein
VALNFVATVAGSKDRSRGSDRFTDPQLLERWFCEAELPPLASQVSDHDLERAKDLREAIFRLADNRLTALEISASDIALLNRHARTGVPPLKISCDGCTTEPPDAAEVDELLGIIARDAIDVFTGPYRGRVRQCASPKCAVIFVDRSPTGNRRWCSMSPCGDKASAQAYRERKKSSEE